MFFRKTVNKNLLFKISGEKEESFSMVEHTYHAFRISEFCNQRTIRFYVLLFHIIECCITIGITGV